MHSLSLSLPNNRLTLDRPFHTLFTVLLVALMVTVLFTSACTFSSVLAEGVKIITYLPLAANIALPLVCLDPGLCLAATAAVAVFDKSQALVLTFFQQWQAASASAAPGLLAQLKAALDALGQSYQGLLSALRVSDPGIGAEVGAILAAILSSISQIGQLVGVTIAAGGTTTAAARVVRITLIPGIVKVSTGTSRLSRTSKDIKAECLAAVRMKTGNAAAARMNASFQKQVKSW